ncbi:MAG: hypothetical protein HY461_00725 [Parcubacteria group bacterium]|nr:hypothetical protein [Parcubacteria group bacterium]
MIQLAIRKVKPGKIDALRAWFDQLHTQRRDEAIATLPYESVLHETTFLFEQDGQWYAVWYMESEGEPKPSDKTVRINQEHAAILQECLEPDKVKIAPAYDLRQ